MTGALKENLGRRLRLFAVLLAVSLSVACSSVPELPDVDDLWGGDETGETLPESGAALAPEMIAARDQQAVSSLYNEALQELRDGQYRSAIRIFGEVERQYPYSHWATQAILMQAYGYYLRNAYEEAITTTERFIALHPGHKDTAYAYYLQAMCYYERIVDVGRDQSVTAKALLALQQVQNRFPGTAYARDAGQKIILARDYLAGKEMRIGRYYIRKKAYLAAINRFRTVVTQYQATSYTPEALFRLTEAYLALGVRNEAQIAAAVLGHNFPNSRWYRDAYGLLRGENLAPAEDDESWMSKALDMIMG